MWLGSQVVIFWGLAVINGDDPHAPMPNDFALSFARVQTFYGAALLVFGCFWFCLRYARKKPPNSN
jgi:hypothetical protein